METRITPAASVALDYWRRFLIRTVAPESAKDVNRGKPRYPYFKDGVLEYIHYDVTSRCHMSLLEVAEDGITGRTDDEVPPGAKARFEFSPEGKPLVLTGVVVHCTQTLGGFKTGIRLEFSATPGTEPRKIQG